MTKHEQAGPGAGEKGSQPERPHGEGRSDEERSFVAESAGAAKADAAVSRHPQPKHGDTDAPHARRAEKPLDRDDKPDQLADKTDEAEDRQEALIDEAVEETFPASDPVAAKRIT